MSTHRESGIRRLREHVVYAEPNNPYVTVYCDDVEWRDGSHGRYNRIVEGTGRSGVVVLPILSSGVGLVLVDRYPVNRQLWELPRGFGESSDPAEDARRELLEETGWIAERLTDLGAVYLNSGLLDGDVRVFAAYIDGRQSAVETDPEARARQIVPVPRLREMLVDGELPDAATQSAILLATLRELI